MAPPRPHLMSWIDNIPKRAALEADARAAFPHLRYARRQRGKGKVVHVYEINIAVAGYEARLVRIEFEASAPWFPRIFTDGPTDSPHRYSKRELCIWYPRDDADRRWVPEDGLLVLLGMIVTHLFKEAYWRQTGEWLGDEAPHRVEEGAA